MDTKFTFKDVYAFQEDGTWYISMIVERETDKEVVGINIPKVKLVGVNDDLGIFTEYAGDKKQGVRLRFGGSHCSYNHNTYDCEEGDLVFDTGIKAPKIIKSYYSETVIKEKTHEMTLEEIEKKLGYKVKIISKK